MLVIRLSIQIQARLDELAKRTGRSKAYHGREAIFRHIDDLEERYLAEQVLLRIRHGEEPTSPLAEVAVRLGLED